MFRNSSLFSTRDSPGKRIELETPALLVIVGRNTKFHFWGIIDLIYFSTRFEFVCMEEN
jgi:hypothetical protein